MSRLNRPILISIEGADCCGKSSVVKELEKYYEDECVVVRNPGASEFSKELREILFKYDNLNNYTEASLMIAAMTEDYFKIVAEAMKENKIIIFDRYIDSTIVYQGLNISKDDGENINRMINESPLPPPDLTFIIKSVFQDIDDRLSNSDRDNNRFDNPFKIQMVKIHFSFELSELTGREYREIWNYDGEFDKTVKETIDNIERYLLENRYI